MKLKEKVKTWKEIFGKLRYLLLAIAIALIFYSANVLIANWATIYTFYSSNGFIQGTQIFFTLFLGFGNTIEWYSYYSLILIGLLLGIFFSLVVYRTKMSVNVMGKKGTGVLATLGVFLGILGPGCAACGMGVLSALGLGVIAVNFLPLKGFEISILSIAILVFSISKLTDKISNGNSCSVKLKGGKNE